MKWLRTEIVTGMQKLLCLRLSGCPSDDMIAGTVGAWMEAITDNRVWDEERDIPRIRAAFRSLAKSRVDWPRPAEFLRELPPPPEVRELPPPRDPEVAKRNLARINDMLRRNGIPAAEEDEA